MPVNPIRLTAILCFVALVFLAGVKNSDNMWGDKTSPTGSQLPTDTVSRLSAQRSLMAEIPVRRRLQRTPLAEGDSHEIKRYDMPGEAADFYSLKRAPVGQKGIPVEKYLTALDHIKQMPQYATASNRFIPPPEQLPLSSSQSSAFGAWVALGPGNIGGRIRSIVINPQNPQIIYIGGVAGGVWKTTNGGSSWAPLDDLLPNLAISSLAMDPTNPDILYAGTGEGVFNGDAVRGAGIFKTIDGGATWAWLGSTSNSSFYYVNDIVISNDGQRVYAATGTGVWRSTNAGANWNLVLNPGVNGGCLDLAIRTDLPLSDFIFAACGTGQQGAIYRKTNAALDGAWDLVFTESGMGRTSLSIAPSNQNIVYALAASIQAGNYNGGLHAVYRSTDTGATWSARVRNNNPTKLNTVLLSNPREAFRTECANLGGTSQFNNQGWYDNVVAVDPVDPNIVWAGGIDLFRSDDGGANWGIASYWWRSTTSNIGHYVHADQHSIVFHPQYNGTTNRILFVGDDGGIFRTLNARALTATGPDAPCDPDNGIVAWASLNNSIGVTQFYHGAAHPDGNTYFGGAQDNGTVRGTTTAGPENWGEILGGDGGYVAVDPGNTSTIYAENVYLSIQKSTDSGSTFNPSIQGITEPNGAAGNFLFITPFLMDPTTSQRLWIGGHYLWRTADGGANWNQASAAVTAGSVSSIAVAPSHVNHVLAGTSEGYIHRTIIGTFSDQDTIWPASRPRSGYVSSLTFDPVNSNVAYATYSTFGGTHVWKSTDTGATWVGIDGFNSTKIPDMPVHCIVVDPTNSARLYVGTDLGVFVSLDGGATWARENTGFANVVTESLSLNTVGGVTSLFAFTHGRGAWRVTLSTDCTSITPVSQSFSSAGGTGSVNVVAPGGCAWAAMSNANFITINMGGSGSGNGSVHYTVAANPLTTSRSGSITLGDETFTIYQSAGFADVPPTNLFYKEISYLSARGITSGCGGGNYCPDAPVTREQMAVFIEKTLGVFNPPVPSQQRFMDVPPTRFGYAFIDDFARRAITSGCAPNLYCPDNPVTREQMAVFIIRALGIFEPPVPAQQRFLDVPPTRLGYSFIEELAQRGITLGCGSGNYCPDASVTRGQMAAFLVRAFNLFGPAWAKTYDLGTAENGRAGSPTNDGGLYAIGDIGSGTSNSDVWVLRVLADGRILWQKRFGSPTSEYVNPGDGNILSTSDGGCIIGGVGGIGGFIMKLSPDGNVDWQKQYNPGSVRFLQQTSDDGCIAILNYSILLKLNPDGSIAWQRKLNGPFNTGLFSVSQTSDAGYILAGSTGDDAFIMKLNASGNTDWQKIYGGIDGQRLNLIQETIDGGYIAGGGYVNDSSTCRWILKLNFDGSIVWQRKLITTSGSATNWVDSLHEASDGGYVVIPGGSNFILKLNLDGSIFWERRYAGPTVNSDAWFTVRESNSGGMVAVGQTYGYPVGGGANLWIMRLNPDGTVPFLDARTSFFSSVDTNVVPTETTALFFTDVNITVTNANFVLVDTNATIQQQAP